MTDTAAPRAATGRLTLNPGDTIASVWGNITYDQTMEVFDTAAQRDSQWPTPHDGALAYTLDTQTAWLRRSGAWLAMAVKSDIPAADTAWTNVTAFTNGWTAGATPPAYIKLAGVVYLRGNMAPGTAAQPAFTLPAGYRPAIGGNYFTVTSTGTATTQVLLTGAGGVQPANAVATYLTNIVFPII